MASSGRGGGWRGRGGRGGRRGGRGGGGGYRDRDMYRPRRDPQMTTGPTGEAIM